ncbi:MAG: hypothetical protein AB7E26_11700, partial [Chryseobacterium sp.]
MNYKTPGVYVEELEKFPPSVAQVETAIPAFIGYTAFGQKNKPTRITSMLEYEQLFGKANPETFAVAFKDGVATATQPKVSDFKMYYAMQMYFANGGGPCYIVSVGHYDDEVTVGPSTAEGTLLFGLELLKKEDEPTLIVFPDLQDSVATDDDVSAANAALQLAEDNEEVATAAEAAAKAVSDAVDGADVAIAVAAAVAIADDYEVTDPNDLSEVAAAQAAQAVLSAAQAAAAIVNASVASVKAAAKVVADAYKADLTTATEIVASANENAVHVSNAKTAAAVAYSVYNSALNQAELMKDRFVIMDVLGNDAIFRDKVNASGLKYGAAYYPKLKTILSYAFEEADVLVTGASGINNLADLKSA